MINSYVLLIMVAIIYASNLVLGKSVTTAVPPFTLAFLRIFIATVFIFPIGFKQWHKNKGLWLKEWKALVGLSLTGLALFNGLVYLSLNFTTSINAGIVESTTPILSILIGFFILKERFTPLQYVGVILSLIGVLWVLSRGSLETILNLSFNRGDLIMLVAIFCWVFYSIFVKQHAAKFPVYGGLFIMNLIALAFLFPLTLIEWPRIAMISWDTSILLSLLYLGTFPSVLALIAWNHAVGDIGPSKASIFLNLIPVFTVIGAILFLEETITWMQLIGGALVLCGVFLTTKEKQKVEETIEM
ncbi:DMT family transporter [Bacillus sp. Marseille-P3661]|uniref:DMT family transporter n=1 Tax=Bacillus sp. Marseille-P3661 TaxID=1936234 RepID=UPI002155B6F5|nr:DMT family transporter [Bacillus sp. Marseille-P3661]